VTDNRIVLPTIEEAAKIATVSHHVAAKLIREGLRQNKKAEDALRTSRRAEGS